MRGPQWPRPWVGRPRCVLFREPSWKRAGWSLVVIQRLTGASVLEIDKLVTDLQGLRDFLSTEADRAQRQITGFVHLGNAAMKSTDIIADSVSQRRGAIDGGGRNGVENHQQHTAPTAEGSPTESSPTPGG